MNSSAVINMMAAMAITVACLATEPAAAQVLNMNRYGKQQLAQKQNRYGNTAWPSGSSGNRLSAAGWPSSALYGGTMMRHYPVSTSGRYLQTAIGDGGGDGRQGDDFGYDVTDLQAGGSPYDSRSYDRLEDYAVVRYPSYGGMSSGGYYSPSVADLQYDARDDGDDDLRLTYEDAVFGGRDPVAAAYSSGPYYSAAAAAYNRYRPSAVTAPLQSNVMMRPYDTMMAPRYHPPTDKIHKFRKVFMSNLVSPSNAFKSPKEQQLYEFWESLINGDLDSDSHQHSQQFSRDRQPYAADDSNSVTSQLYQHLPPIFQQLQQQQKLKQQQQRSSADHDRKSSSSYSAYTSSSSSPSSASPSASSSQTVPRGNLYKQWANGSPLIKRSSVSSTAARPPRPATSAAASSETAAVVEPDTDDVRQLEKLKTDNTTTTNDNSNTTAAATVDTATAVTDDATKTAVVAAVAATPLMADGGQREYVLPRPAGEKSGFESLLEVIAEGGLHGNVDKNTAAAYRKLHQEAKVNKKRSYVSDETSLAAQLGALRKN